MLEKFFYWGGFGSILLGCLCLILHFYRRERRMANQIQSMLENAIAGKFEGERYDESAMSVVENDMWRYLNDNQIFCEKLVQEKEQMQKHISEISHQVTIPIANIVLYAQLLEEWLDCGNEQEIREGIKTIREQADKIDFLMDSLAQLSRLEIGIINVSVEKQPIEPVLEAVRNQFMHKAEEKNIRFYVMGTKEEAVFDRKWTVEAIANVVDNAIKYTPDGGTVSICIETYSSFLRVNIADSGIGISEKEHGNVFSRFYRSEDVREKPGLGIGLYLVREVMKAQRGYVKLNSSKGKGSVFSLFFTLYKS